MWRRSARRRLWIGNTEGKQLPARTGGEINKEEKKLIQKINEQDFQTKVVNDEVAVVDFSATWCGPCRMLAPVLEQISEELAGKANFYNVDVDDDSALAAGFGISSVPTVLILKKGKVVDQSLGFKPGPAVKSWIEGNI